MNFGAPNPIRLFEAPPPPPGAPSQALVEQFQRVAEEHKAIGAQLDQLGKMIGGPLAKGELPSKLEIFYGYIGVFFVAFLVALIATPIMRRLAIANGIIDRPNEARKAHTVPIAYLGGAAVFLGIMAGVLFSYAAPLHGLLTFHKTKFLTDTGIPFPVPLSVIFGLGMIMLTGLLDDVLNISPWQKVGGQLLAAAFLAMENVGVKVAFQLLYPIGAWLGYGPDMAATGKFVILSLGGLELDVVYWTGTAIIAIFVLGACNASNLIDGLDGLLSGVTTIANASLLVVALGLAAADGGELDAARIVLCLAVIGGCMGFLPHNFNPAVIFLGDCGSLLLGYITIVIVLTLGNEGRTDLVLAGLVIYAIPILDAALAIIRRKMSGKSIADADDQHLHHMFKRALGVKGAVFVLYGIGALFGVLGVLLAMGRARVTYAITLVVALFIATIAIKIARRRAIEEQAQGLNDAPASPPQPPSPRAAPAPAAPTGR
ncbi:MAG: undecaprenyl/decaprenyl-phosphate alpha-N-acetylglucosaminyl 1-phosphate transferase [Phycisphaerae bacterium]|nr:undecaprenyl/decaprenyl-phosphate alpha-N-acetylglucosaminyl 1-phosphate transferase [Phycisphaerae bacterium]